MKKLFENVILKVTTTLNNKCHLPTFKSYSDLDHFQKTVLQQIKIEYNETQFKWVNYMDEVLEIWQDLCGIITENIITEALNDLLLVF